MTGSRETGKIARRILTAALATVLAFVAWPARAATDGDATAPKPAKKSFNVRHPLPFKFGENLRYDVKFSRFPISANVGEVNFSVLKPATDRHVKFEVSATSRGALVSLFGVKVEDVFTTLADRDDLFVYSTIKNLHENEFRQRQEAVFDRQTQHVRYRVIDPAAPNDQSKVVDQETRPWVLDVVSAVYFARTRKLKNVGREVVFPISDEGQTYNIGVALVGREQVKVDAGTFQTLKVEAKIFGGRFVRREGELYIWLTDDARRIPVKALMKTEKGTATFSLTRLDEGREEILPTTPQPAAPAAAGEDDDQ
jgi:hypothetical protein